MRRLCFLLLIAASPVAAHDFWVQPQAFQAPVATAAPFTIQVDADPPSTPGAVLVVQPDEVGVTAPSTDPG